MSDIVEAPRGLQIDLLCAIARMDQIRDTPDDEGWLRELLIMRLECDANRLRKYLTPETMEWADSR